MSRQFCAIADAEVFFEGFASTATCKAEDLIEEASEWVYANIAEFHPTPSIALPLTGVSPNYWVRTATANEAIYLSLNRRLKTSLEAGADPYWYSFHQEAVAILADIYDGKHRLEPDPKLSKIGIGIAEATANGTIVGQSTWVESNSYVPTDYYRDDVYQRIYYVEIESLGATLKTSKFKWRTNMDASDEYNTGVFMNTTYSYMSHGVAVRFLQDDFSDFEVGMIWKITAIPERDRKQRQKYGTYFMERG